MERFNELSQTHYAKKQRRDFAVPKSITLTGEGKCFAVFKTSYDEWGDLEYEYEPVSKQDAYKLNENNPHYWEYKCKKLRKKIDKDKKKLQEQYKRDLRWNINSYERKKHYSITEWWSICNEKIDGKKILHYNYINHLLKRQEIMTKVNNCLLFTQDEKDFINYIGKFNY